MKNANFMYFYFFGRYFHTLGLLTLLFLVFAPLFLELKNQKNILGYQVYLRFRYLIDLLIRG